MTHNLVPGIWYQVPGCKYQVPSTRYLVPGTRYQVSGTWYKVPGTRYKVPGSDSSSTTITPKAIGSFSPSLAVTLWQLVKKPPSPFRPVCTFIKTYSWKSKIHVIRAHVYPGILVMESMSVGALSVRSGRPNSPPKSRCISLTNHDDSSRCIMMTHHDAS